MESSRRQFSNHLFCRNVSIKFGPLSISRRGSSYESDLELWYSLFPVQWDRNDSICSLESKKYTWSVGTFSFQVS